MDLSVLFNMSYGVYIVSTTFEGKHNGQIANAVIQVTAEPLQIQAVINKQNLTHDLILKSKKFAISILSTEATLPYIGRFGFKSGRDINKFSDDIQFKISDNGLAIPLDYTLGFIECELNAEYPCETHTLFIGKFINSEKVKDGEAMSYIHYHQIKKGKEPKTAPTYIKIQ